MLLGCTSGGAEAVALADSVKHGREERCAAGVVVDERTHAEACRCLRSAYSCAAGPGRRSGSRVRLALDDPSRAQRGVRASPPAATHGGEHADQHRAGTLRLTAFAPNSPPLCKARANATVGPEREAACRARTPLPALAPTMAVV